MGRGSDAAKILFDSYEDAAAQLREWLREAEPDQVVCGWREPENSMVPLTGSAEAVRFLLDAA
jgi:hypothetical protein